MASVASTATTDLDEAELGSGRPYAPSWLDWIVTWFDDLPGPTWLAYVVFAVLALAWTSTVGWLVGDIAFGTFDFTQSSYAFFLVFPFALLHVLRRAAGRALWAFAPALDASPSELARLEYELTTIPPRPALALGLAGALMDVLSWVGDPVGADVVGADPAGLVLRAAGEYLLVGAWFVLMYQVYRQLRQVSRLHTRAATIDLYHPSPLYAFSHLTVRAGIGFVSAAAWTLLTSPPELLLTAISVSFLLAVVFIGAAAFVVPLRGMQARLAHEQERLIDAANERLEMTIARLHAAVDSGDLTPADQLQKTLAALVQEREIVGRLRTWPWDPSTLRAFASAIALPIGLWLITRALERVL